MVAETASIVIVACFSQLKPMPGVELSLNTKPLLSVVGLNRKDLFSVSTYQHRSTPRRSYVYRYVFKGDCSATMASFQHRLGTKDGWTSEKVGPHEWVLSRNLATGPVAYQALVFHATRLMPSPPVGKPLPFADGKGWVWISYNELIRTN